MTIYRQFQSCFSLCSVIQTGLLLFYGQRRSLLLATILASSEDYLWEAIKGSQHEAFIGLIDATIIKTKTNNLV